MYVEHCKLAVITTVHDVHGFSLLAEIINARRIDTSTAMVAQVKRLYPNNGGNKIMSYCRLTVGPILLDFPSSRLTINDYICIFTDLDIKKT